MISGVDFTTVFFGNESDSLTIICSGGEIAKDILPEKKEDQNENPITTGSSEEGGSGTDTGPTGTGGDAGNQDTKDEGAGEGGEPTTDGGSGSQPDTGTEEEGDDQGGNEPSNEPTGKANEGRKYTRV
jgi:hypothetical protein